MDVIFAKPNGEEVGFLTDFDLDLEVGGSNDFEVGTTADEKIMDFRWKIYVNDTEYGGIISDIDVDTASNRIAYSGQTWRGLLDNYIITPGITIPNKDTQNVDYLTVSDNVSTIISGLISHFGIDSLYTVAASTATVTNYQFDRYCTLLTGIDKMLKSVGYRLNVKCTNGTVELKPVQIHDYSDELEYSQDADINFRIRENRNGVNHLICLGKGELHERTVINLYLRQDGTIGTTGKYYTGISERAAVYDYSSVESAAELEKSGRERFEELINSQKLEMTIDDISVELGDIVGGRERITGIYMQKPITLKIVKATDKSSKISYKVGD